MSPFLTVVLLGTPSRTTRRQSRDQFQLTCPGSAIQLPRFEDAN
jgi:hypothetical protein